jgi:Flp pilus assembly protein TadG
MRPHSLRRFLRARDGAAAVEFAFTLPVLLFLLFGMVELGQLLVAKHRTDSAGSSVGDIVSRLSSVTNTQEQDIFAAASDIMGSSAVRPPDLRVSEIYVMPNGSLRYIWSDAQGSSMPAFTHCAAASLPQMSATVLTPGSYFVLSEIRYAWNSPFNFVLKNGVILSSTSVLSPRTGSVTRQNASTTPC